jgi:hypothetical protein
MFGLALTMEERPKKKSDVIRIEKLPVKSGQEIIWVTDKKPVYASFDPLNTLTDILPEDNTKKIDWE